jgi:hypothetical protein
VSIDFHVLKFLGTNLVLSVSEISSSDFPFVSGKNIKMKMTETAHMLPYERRVPGRPMDSAKEKSQHHQERTMTSTTHL